MACVTRFAASATVGSLMVLGVLLGSGSARAQNAAASGLQPIGHLASVAPGSIVGVVQDERGTPIAGVVVSALGSTTTVAVTDTTGRFTFGTLAPGPYLLRAHLSGYIAPRAQMVQVRASARAASAIELRRAEAPILAAGIGLVETPSAAAPAAEAPASPPAAPNGADDADEGETAWRLRHARRGILKDVTIPAELLADNDPHPGFIPVEFLGRAVGAPARAATNFFADTPFSGQVNLLATGSFDGPQRLFSTDTQARDIAYLSVGAPVGEHADWMVRGALTQADISAWILAGSYTTRAPARHRYDVGMSYSTQRYEGANPLALRDLTDGSRNAGTVYAFDSFTISPALTLTYGTAYSRYDYLDSRGLLSPRAEVTISPIDRLRISGEVSRRALAPGAEEFLPPGDSGIWMPPQRTFSSVREADPFDAERVTHAAVAVERDLGTSTVAFRAFRQSVTDQLVALFGQAMPDAPAATLGHYLVGNAGDVDATGYTAELRTTVANRIHGSVAYSAISARMRQAADVQYLLLLAPSALRPAPDRIQDLSASIETTVPETATRVLVLYRISNAFAAAPRSSESSRPALDGRFDVQVRQSLPFMNFSNARWEMLLAVRNFFRETAPDQSVYDELLVVRPPKRLVGGVTLHF